MSKYNEFELNFGLNHMLDVKKQLDICFDNLLLKGAGVNQSEFEKIPFLMNQIKHFYEIIEESEDQFFEEWMDEDEKDE